MSKEHHSEHHSAHEHKAEHAPKEKTILGFGVKTIVLMAVLVLGTAIIATIAGYGAAQLSVKPVTTPSTVSIDKVLLKSNVDKYFKDNQLAVFGSESVSLTVGSIEDANDGLVIVNYSISDGTNTQEGKFFASNERVYVANAVFDLTQNLPVPTVEPTASTTPVKTDKPVVDLYVMSFCPYGNQAEDTMKPVFTLLKDKATFNVHYIVSVNGNDVQSLHGAPEVVQNEREACVLKNYDTSKWFDFVTYVNTNCGSSGSCWEAGATALGIDKAKINTCVTTEGVALMQANDIASSTAGASGSPTMIINGVQSSAVYQYGNAEAYKQAICGSFNTAPSECSTALGTTTSASAGGSC